MSVSQPIDSLRIRGFRGLEDLTLDGCGRFNLLLGANDVGKTSVMEAIFLLSGLLNPQIPGGLQELRAHPFREMLDLKWIFQGADIDGTITLESRSNAPLATRSLDITAPRSNVTLKGDPTASGNGSPSATRPPSTAHRPRVLKYLASLDFASDAPPITVTSTLFDRGDRFTLVMDPEEPPPGAELLRINTTYIGPRATPDPEVLGEVIVNKRRPVLLEYLKGIDPRICDLAIHDDTAHLDISLDQMLPLNMFGAGVGRAAQILAVSLVTDHRILLIDEIENGLHYRAIPPLLESVLRLARERDFQVFATTHRLGLIQGLQEVLAKAEFTADRSATKCFTLQRDREGLVRSYRYDHSQFDHCIRQGIEIR